MRIRYLKNRGTLGEPQSLPSDLINAARLLPVALCRRATSRIAPFQLFHGGGERLSRNRKRSPPPPSRPKLLFTISSGGVGGKVCARGGGTSRAAGGESATVKRAISL